MHCSFGLHQNLGLAIKPSVSQENLQEDPDVVVGGGGGEVEADVKEEERPAAVNTCTRNTFDYRGTLQLR